MYFNLIIDFYLSFDMITQPPQKEGARLGLFINMSGIVQGIRLENQEMLNTETDSKTGDNLQTWSLNHCPVSVQNLTI